MAQSSSQTSAKPPRLPIGLRKFLGMVILLVGLAIYAITAVWFITSILPDHWSVQIIFYPLAGIAWAFPARYLIAWMQKPDDPANK